MHSETARVRRVMRCGLAGLVAALLLAALALAPPATGVRAATLTVTNCNDDGSVGSLRQVLGVAVSGDTITFAQNCTGANAITLSDTLTPAVNVTIDATVRGHTVTISGGGAVHLFRVNSGITLGLTGLTLTGGNASIGVFGGAIENYGTVTITGSTLSGNSASRVYYGGGAIYNSAGGTVTITGSTLSGNSAPNGGGGGAIYSRGTMTLTNSTLSDNSAPNSGSGGAIYSSNTMTITNSTLSGNSAPDGNGVGGAIYSSNTMTITNSTLSGNSAPNGYGGAIYNGGTMTITGSTLSGNSAPNGDGGAIENDGTVTLTLAVVAGNTASFGPDIIDYGTVTSGGGNVVGITDGNTGSSVTPLPSLLGPLANNSGPVQTEALLPGSPAIDIAACPADLTSDARGVSRPQGANCDAGAFESRGFTASALTGNNQSAAITTAFTNPVGFTVSDANSEPVAGGQVTFTITPGTGGASATFGTSATCTVTSATVAVCTIPAGGITTSPPFTANSTAGAFTIIATASGVPTTTFTETNAPGPATHIAVTGFPSSTTAGTAGSVTVTALDAGNNTATSYTGTVAITSSDARALLPANATLTHGVGAFNVTLKTAGMQTITATDTVTASITGTQSGITVTPGPAARFTVTGCPSPILSGTPCTVTVTAQDANGNTVTSYTGTVAITSSDARAILPANATLTNGVGTFSVTLRTLGTQSITATDTVTGTITGTVTITVTGTAPTAVNDGPYTVATGLTLTVPAATGVLANDTQGNPVATISANTQPAHGTLMFTTSDGSFVYTPTSGYVGNDSFTYTLTNSVGSSTGTVSITVTGIAPTATNDTYTVTIGTTLTVNAAQGVLTNDTKGNPPATISANTQPAHGTLTFTTTDGSFVYTPTAGYVGADSFTYTLTNSVGSSTGTVNLTVTVATVTGLTTVAPTGTGSGNTGTASAPTVPPGGTLTLTTTGSYNNGTSGTLTSGLRYTSSNAGVARVDPTTGQVTGIAGGSVTITVTGPNGTMTTITVTVSSVPTGGLSNPNAQPMTHPVAPMVEPSPMPMPQPQPPLAPHPTASGGAQPPAAGMPVATPVPQPVRH